MKKTLFVIFVLLFSFAWCFGAGMFVYRALLWKPCDNSVGQSSKLRKEYDLLFVSDKHILNLDFYQTGKEFYGNAYLFYKPVVIGVVPPPGVPADQAKPAPVPGQTWTTNRLQKDEIKVVEADSLSNLKYSVEGSFKVDGADVSFSVSDMYLPLAVRGEEEFSKIGGAVGEESVDLFINGQREYAKAALLVGFNYNPTDVDLSATGIDTSWAMFFDDTGKFYHLDDTRVQHEINGYTSHAFFGSYQQMQSFVFLEPSARVTGDVVDVSYRDFTDSSVRTLQLSLGNMVKRSTGFNLYAVVGKYSGVYLKVKAE